MNHISYVRFVDPHSECNRCDDDIHFTAQEIRMHLLQHLPIHPSMIGTNPKLCSLQCFGNAFHVLSCSAVDNGCPELLRADARISVFVLQEQRWQYSTSSPLGDV